MVSLGYSLSWSFSEAVSRGVQGGGANPLIDHQGGAGDPSVIFDIFYSGFYTTYTNYTS